ncbi:hypothetical protein Tco_0538722 [Tanacetum coccineum]
MNRYFFNYPCEWPSTHSKPILKTFFQKHHIRTKIGLDYVHVTPMMLDSCTVMYAICMNYAQALIDLRADRVLKDTLVIYVPRLDGNGFMMHIDRVEYDWKPLRCGTCLVFGHDDVLCPTRVITELKNKDATSHDGFQTRYRKVFRGLVAREHEGKININHPTKQQLIPVKLKNTRGVGTSNNTLVSNVFEVLGDMEDDGHLDAHT